MKSFASHVNTFIADESGQDLIEYALIASLVALVAVVTLRPLGQTIATIFTTINTSLGGATT